MSVSINSFITNTDETLRTDDGNTFFFKKYSSPHFWVSFGFGCKWKFLFGMTKYQNVVVFYCCLPQQEAAIKFICI